MLVEETALESAGNQSGNQETGTQGVQSPVYRETGTNW